MLEKIKERVKAWKRFYTQGCRNIDENSSWHEILMELEYYNFSKFERLGRKTFENAVNAVGAFSDKEDEFLKTLPAYAAIKTSLRYDNCRENFTEVIDGEQVFSVCSAQDDDFPIREYTIITDRKDLLGLEIYVFRDEYHYKCGRHGIIRYDNVPPDNYNEAQSLN